MKSGKADRLTQCLGEIIHAVGQARVKKIVMICDIVMDE